MINSKTCNISLLHTFPFFPHQISHSWNEIQRTYCPAIPLLLNAYKYHPKIHSLSTMESPAAVGGARNWSDLPPELLGLISGRLPDIEDYARFRAVCTPWRSAASLPRLLPWLLLPYRRDDTLRRFYSLSNKRIYKFDLPAASGCAIYTSPHGYLLMSDPSLSLSLLNPITGSHLPLPPVPRPPGSHEEYLHARLRRARPAQQQLMLRGVFQCCSFVSEAGEFIVVLLAIASRQFLYCRQHDRAWSKPDAVSLQSPIVAVAYHRGRFHIVHQNGDVAVCDATAEAKPELVPSLKVPVEFLYCYFVVLGDDLLLVTESWPTFCYFKLDAAAGELKYSQIPGIGDYTLFLTAEENVLAAAAGDDVSGCKRDCIYVGGSTKYSSQVLDVVSIKDGSSEEMQLLEEETCPDMERSTWFFPRLC